MKRRRFRVTELQHHRKYRGVITAADLRAKFNIPEGADITITIPGGGDWSGMTVGLGDNEPITCIEVAWEEIK